MMKKWLSWCLIGMLSWSCSTVPVTGRTQLRFIPSAQMQSLSYAQYSEVLNTSRLSKNAEQTAMIKRVGARMQKSVETYLAQNGLSDRLNGFAWEFNLIEDKTANAWCMPGGKVAFYTGILPICETENGIAIVMGHEIAHAIARHGNERMSQGLMLNAAGQTLGAVMGEKPGLAKDIFLQSYGIGSQLGMLAYSRNHESEADKLGLVFMAMAGYDPQASIGFWERMSTSGGQAPPEILSTHPSDETRIATLKEFMPEALKYYKKP